MAKTKITPNLVATLMAWIAVLALIVIAWGHLWIARALEGIATEHSQEQVVTVARMGPD